MIHEIQYIGKIHFEPENVTKKHELQGAWKKTSMVLFDGDIVEYYQWFLMKNYGLKLNKPLRGAHVTFISDRFSEIYGETEEEKQQNWNAVKLKWEGKEIPVNLLLSPRTDAKHWWLNVSEEHRIELQGIRHELGLGRPYFGMHLTIGYANEKNILHSSYIHKLLIFNELNYGR